MEESRALHRAEEDGIELPPGFRFHPTDEELITHYLSNKVLDSGFIAKAIGEVDLNKCEPWDLPERAKMGEKECYFFCVKDRKYPTGLRTNRATDSGYWKATGKDKEIQRGKSLVGMKKTLVFYKGRAPRGEKTNWVMHEYRMEGKFSIYNLPKTAKNEWVICRVFQKSSCGKKTSIPGLMRLSSVREEFNMGAFLPPLIDSPYANTLKNAMADPTHVTCFSIPMEIARKKPNHILPTLPFTSSSSFILPQANSFPHSIFAGPDMLSDFANSGVAQDNSFLRALLDTSCPGLKQSCKAEEMVSLSQETGLTMSDMNAEISSVVSNGEIAQPCFAKQDDHLPTNAGPVDIDCLWTY